MSEENSDSKNASILTRLSSLWGFNESTTPLEKMRLLLSQAKEDHLLGDDTAQMMENLFHINETRVRDIMIPRGQIVMIEEDAKIEDILHIVLEWGHSRYPVVDEDHEKVRGILLSKDLLPFLITQENIPTLADLWRPATIVPESKPLDAMLRDFKINRNHMALVIDEYGNLSGLVTIEDVIEEIVGEIDDEHDEIADSPIKANPDGSYQVKALTPIDEFNAVFGLALSDEDADTISGYLQQQMGKMPTVGESLELGDWKITVTKANQRRLISLFLQKRETPPEESAKTP